MKFYLTFGCTHPLGDNWVEIEAEHERKARTLAFDTFGEKWSSIYNIEKWEKAEVVNFFPGGRVGKILM
jgi:hypothetical protein